MTNNSYAGNVLMPCLKDNGDIGINKFLSFECKIAKSVVNDPQIKNAYKKKFNNRLAGKLSKKLSQRLDEIAFLDSYFEQNQSKGKNDLMLGSQKVKDSCRLDLISNPKCEKGINQEKLDLLLSKFPKKDNPDGKPEKENLFKKLKEKMTSVRGADFTSKNTCPASGESGYFSLSSQFTELIAENFIESGIRDSKSGKKNSASYMSSYDNYPQLKMIKDASETSEEGKAFFKEFEEKLRAGNIKKGSYKDFLNDLIFSERSTKVLANVLADRCLDIAKDVKTYLCEDSENLKVSDDVANSLFDDETKDDEASIMTAKGFSCSSENTLGKVSNVDSGINTKYEKLTSNIRVVDEAVIEKDVGQFCSVYMCKDDSVKNKSICQGKKHLTSADLINTCGGKIELCDYKIQSYINYIQSLEEDTQKVESAQNNSMASSPEEQKKKKGFSSFFQNFMGVEGTLMAEGKKATPAAIAEKTAEFAEKKIEPTVQSSVAQAKPVEARQEPLAPMVKSQEAPADYEQQATVVATTNPSQNADKYKDAFYSTNGSPSDKSAKAVAIKTNKLDIPDTSDPRADEMKKIRKELEEALSGFQGTEEEKLGTITDNNRAIVAPKSVVASDSGRNVNQAEKDRLDQYRQSLNDWESRLRDRETRNFMNSGNGSGGSGSASGSVAGRDASGGGGSSSSGSSGSASDGGAAGGAPSLKLSKGAGGAVAAKADGTSERGTASEKAENENGVLNADTLAILKKETLKDLGIVASDSFVIKIRYQNKIYPIPVKTFVHDGKSMYVPLLTDKSSELAKIVYESPLFNDYRRYQLERHLKQTKDQ